ncbi:MAG: hypothetical protein IT193_01980 [Propionibacteriaceae bacterium]|nr:hypothetical protein [Propionibacteriaceae bacterium]
MPADQPLAGPAPPDRAVADVGDPGDTFPQPVRWIGRWPWSAWTRWHRTSVVGHLVGRLLLGLAGFTSALVLVLGLGPQAYRAVFWREAEYQVLAGLHAGNSLSYLVGQLGEPAFVKPALAGTQLTQHIFLRRDHLVMAVTSGAEVVVLSVLSCDAGFAPDFVTPDDTLVQLQARPLHSAETGRDARPISAGAGSGLVSYAPWSTASSVNQLVVEGAAVSNASRGRAFYFGVNGACADLDSLGAGTEPYFGDLAGAPDTVEAATARSGANFYAETMDLEVALGENAQAGVLIDGQWRGGLFLSPYHFDLPTALLVPGGTRRH